MAKVPAYLAGVVFIAFGFFLGWHAFRLLDVRQVVITPATAMRTPMPIRVMGGCFATAFSLGFCYRGARLLLRPPDPDESL
jgi:hypothetical protein